MRLDRPASGLSVLLNGRRVGRLAETTDGLVAFQYDETWLRDGFSLNPHSLPLEDRVFVPKWEPFGGLFGVFHDSLPDGWGALLVDRMLREHGVDPGSVSTLTRLSLVGCSGRGALEYEPEANFPRPHLTLGLDELASLFQDILANRPVDDLDAAFAAGGSSGGARPKAYVEDANGSWIVKFPSSMDPCDIGVVEYEYSQCASACGIEVPEARLFPSDACSGYFGTRRFDIASDGSRLHMASASGIAEVSHRVPALDYESLFQISYLLTGSADEAMRLFRLMCFNVFAHNYDDHSNNFSWLCEEGRWRLSPAYDLTYSDSFGHGHATSVMGSGTPGMSEVLELAAHVGLNEQWAKRTAEDIRDACGELLGRLGL